MKGEDDEKTGPVEARVLLIEQRVDPGKEPLPRAVEVMRARPRRSTEVKSVMKDANPDD